MKKFLSIIKNILKYCVYVFVFLIVLCNIFLIIQKKLSPDKTPSIFGYKAYVIMSGSMDPAIRIGDLILVQVAGDYEIKSGDVISYHSGKSIVTHRVIEKNIDDDGQIYFKLKGDYNNAADKEKIYQDKIEGKVIKIFTGVGNIILTMQSKPVILIVVTLVIGYFIKNYFFTIDDEDDDEEEDEENSKIENNFDSESKSESGSEVDSDNENDINNDINKNIENKLEKELDDNINEEKKDTINVDENINNIEATNEEKNNQINNDNKNNVNESELNLNKNSDINEKDNDNNGDKKLSKNNKKKTKKKTKNGR